MRRMRSLAVPIVLAVLLLQGCGSSTAPDLFLSSEPALITPQATLDASLNCTPFEHPDKPPVLLVHGTFFTGTEQFTLFYTPQLVAMGYDVCIVTYPDRGLADLQISAEYIVNALRSIHARTGRKVAMIGHSQGATMPRWALKFWPSAREAVIDFVLLAGPNHGTSVAFGFDTVAALFDTLGLSALPVGLFPEALYQFALDAHFITALNTGDETPGDVDYTAIYTQFDELVQPVAPVPTAALDFGQNNRHVANILLQDICPAYLVEHGTIGTTDPVAFALVLDAISHSGPADVTRAGGTSLCRLLPVDVTVLLQAPIVSGLLQIVDSTLQTGLPNPHLAAGEPPLMPYATTP